MLGTTRRAATSAKGTNAYIGTNFALPHRDYTYSDTYDAGKVESNQIKRQIKSNRTHDACEVESNQIKRPKTVEGDPGCD